MTLVDGLLIGGAQHRRICPIRPEIMADPARRPDRVEYNGDDYRRVSYGGINIYVSSQVPAMRTMTAIMEALR